MRGTSFSVRMFVETVISDGYVFKCALVDFSPSFGVRV